MRERGCQCGRSDGGGRHPPPQQPLRASTTRLVLQTSTRPHRYARWSRPSSGGCSWRMCISRCWKKSQSSREVKGYSTPAAAAMACCGGKVGRGWQVARYGPGQPQMQDVACSRAASSQQAAGDGAGRAAGRASGKHGALPMMLPSAAQCTRLLSTSLDNRPSCSESQAPCHPMTPALRTNRAVDGAVHDELAPSRLQHRSLQRHHRLPHLLSTGRAAARAQRMARNWH